MNILNWKLGPVVFTILFIILNIINYYIIIDMLNVETETDILGMSLLLIVTYSACFMPVIIYIIDNRNKTLKEIFKLKN